MAVQARYAAGCLPGVVDAGYGLDAQEYGAFLAAAANNNNGYNHCAATMASGGAQSELTCNNGAGNGAARKRCRGEVEEQYVSSSSALLPIPGMVKAVAPAPAAAMAFRSVDSAMTSTSGRHPASAASSFAADGLVSELLRHNAEIDATVRAELERMRAGLEQARKRQCASLVRAASASAARRLREKEAELDAARRRAAELESCLRQAAAESQAWCGLARSNEAVAAGLRSTLDHLLLRSPAPAPAEGFGESDFTAAGAEADAQSCCFVVPKEDAGAACSKWACKSCGEGEASVLLLPCRHLCLCKACEPRLDACPVCLATKNASVHIATD